MNIEVYTDGSATTSDRPGGWAFVLIVDGKKHSEGSGHSPSATNNDMELEAAIQGLTAIKERLLTYDFLMAYESDPTPYVTLVADSELVLGWASGRYAFRQVDKIDKFKQLQVLVNLLEVKTRWIEGHTGDEHNERCDTLANEARTGKKKKKPKSSDAVTVKLKVKTDRDKLSDFIFEAIKWANSGQYPPTSNYWVAMVVDKMEELMDNNYYSIEICGDKDAERSS